LGIEKALIALFCARVVQGRLYAISEKINLLYWKRETNLESTKIPTPGIALSTPK
jgi:hypothetical protein